MERAKIIIQGIIGGKELGYKDVPTFGYTDLLVALAKYPDAKAFDFVIDTDGGSVAEGFRMAELIESLPDTTTIAKKVYSIGNVLYFAGKERTLDMSEPTIAVGGAKKIFMLHPAAMNGAQVNEAMLNAKQLRGLADELEEVTAMIAAYISSRSGISGTKIINLMAVDRYINSIEATALGFFGERKGSELQLTNLSNMAKNSYSNLVRKVRELLGLSANMAVELADGGTIWAETEDGALLGKKVFTEEGGQPLPDGEYKLPDGRTLVVKNGEVDGEQTDAGEMPEGGETKVEVEVEDTAKALAEARDKMAEMEAELMKYREVEGKYEAVAEERNKLKEELQAANIFLQNVARVTSKPLPVNMGGGDLRGNERNAGFVLPSDAEQLRIIEENRKKR